MGLLSKLLRPWRQPNPQQIVEFAANLERRLQRGSYDAAQTPDDLANYWANTDAFDADSANCRGVRETLVRRSRYELANNGYADGIAQTYATDLVGKGPALQMQTGSEGFNRMVEFQFYLWWQAVGMRRKLWCMAHAKHGDGEGMGVLRINRKIKHRIPLDVVLYETEQFQSSYPNYNNQGRIDGIEFDEFGNPVAYELLRQHPGATNGFGYSLETERIPADRVLHWFKMRRPGQHRGVPECASTLNLGAVFRRGRNAQIKTWEKIASWTLFLKTMFEPEVAQAVTPMSSLDIQHNMMTALPNSVEPYQLKAEHPGANYPEAHKMWLSEQARPKCMSYNKAACDSSGSNYASGRLDFLPYYAALDVDREDCNEQVLDRIFNVWFDMAILAFGWLGGNPEAVSPAARVHTWDWPKHRVADVESEANANRTKLESGQISIPKLKADAGEDAEDDAEAEAAYYGITVEELKRRQLDAIYPPAAQPQPETPLHEPAINQEDAVAELEELYVILGEWVTLDNGVHIEIGDDGTVTKGPPGMVGKKGDSAKKAATASKAAREATSRALPQGSNPTSEHHKESSKRFREAQVRHEEAAKAFEEMGDKGAASLHRYSALNSKKAAIHHEKLAKLHRSKEQGKPLQKIKFSLPERFDIPPAVNGNGVHYAN